MAAADECRQMLYTASTLPGPSAVRSGHKEPSRRCRRFCTEIAERLDATLVTMRFVERLVRTS
jgi:hypothetical protein